jgi:hypothetical protein
VNFFGFALTVKQGNEPNTQETIKIAFLWVNISTLGGFGGP